MPDVTVIAAAAAAIRSPIMVLDPRGDFSFSGRTNHAAKHGGVPPPTGDDLANYPTAGSDPARLRDLVGAGGLRDEPGEGGARLLLPGQQQAQLFQGHRFAEQLSLSEAALVAAQELQVPG